MSRKLYKIRDKVRVKNMRFEKETENKIREAFRQEDLQNFMFESVFGESKDEDNELYRNVYKWELEETEDRLVYLVKSHIHHNVPINRNAIISNPPFTNKRLIFERALSFNKPFALIMSNTWLNDSAPKQLFKDKDLQLLMFDKRMKFMNNGEVQNKITFSSSYYCWNFLPKQIIMEELKY